MTVARARALRKAMTPQEVKLWVQLRKLRPEGLHFRRQAPVDGYVLDFACFKHRVIVEVDGSQHAEDRGLSHDARRDAHFAAHGFRTLRFWNSEIDANLHGVVETILAHARVKEREASRCWPPPDSASRGQPPRKGEGLAHAVSCRYAEADAIPALSDERYS
jgi:very-short-patch-repair endonuclease